MKLQIDTQERTITIDGPCDFDELKVIVEALGGKWTVNPNTGITVLPQTIYPEVGPIWVDPCIVQPSYPWPHTTYSPPLTSDQSEVSPTITCAAQA